MVTKMIMVLMRTVGLITGSTRKHFNSEVNIKVKLILAAYFHVSFRQYQKRYLDF
jgi:hypothetical protein